ncbi:hypothetical protein SASPL_156174 [Salvia splendens]|uniref:Hydroxymethylglutaryl-CoA synthase n=1 Tax=Salvia splendens TaxID=180675 RepID=A0A8X8VX14_SALSN|nr:hypothetical protein SASPL_156174 [Salvia splendens]
MAKNVGILAMEIYFPPTCIQQEVLEAHDGASKGKYTIGLGQDCMAFCSEVEDVISMRNVAILISKVLTQAMLAMEGPQHYLNCVNWVESSSWDGRYGLVVCTDSAGRIIISIAMYMPRDQLDLLVGLQPFAMLIGPNAPIAFEGKLRSSHMAHVYDFYKPDLASEYPVVDGKLSQTCYLMALDACYKGFCQKFEKQEGKQFSILDADYLYSILHTTRHLNKSQNLSLIPRCNHLRSSQNKLGTMYTASLYAAFASLIHNKSSTLFLPEKFVELMQLMEHRYGGKDFITSKDCSLLAPGTYYLTEVDSKYRDSMPRRPLRMELCEWPLKISYAIKLALRLCS